MVKPLDTSELGPIKIDAAKVPHDRLSLLERVNNLNVEAFGKGIRDRFWTVTVLYNTVIYRRIGDFEPTIYEVYEGVLK